MSSAETPQGPRIVEDLRCDVCVVGAGIAGLSTAYLLTRAGKKVFVLDDGPTAGGESARTTAHLGSYIDDGLVEIERLHGLDGLKLAHESHAAAIDQIESIVQAEAIDCDFQRLDAFKFITPGGEGIDYLLKELDAAHRIGWKDAELVDRAPMPDFDTARCLRFPNQGQFHPLKYLAGLAMAIRRQGGEIHNHVHAATITGGQPAATVQTSQGRKITCDAVVVATNTPVNDLVAIHTKQHPYRTYAIGLKIPRGYVPHALYWDTLDPYHYVRLQPLPDDEAHEVLIAGGEDHKTGQASDFDRRYQALEEWTRQRWPAAKEVLFRWSGQVMEPVDGLAYVGRNPLDKENVFIATGDSGMGMTHGTIAGMLLTDLILGRSNPWAPLYDPSRVRAKSAMEYAKENLNVAKEYLELATPGEVASADEILPGHGAVMRRGLTKVACYREPSGQLHEYSAICPHLKCVVHWNDFEQSWDCPCHGSRFDCFGQVVNGPANTNLPTAQ